ncbi:MAG: hypothetical protein ABI700_02670, partial [Chloroflexota bacterium]
NCGYHDKAKLEIPESVRCAALTMPHRRGDFVSSEEWNKRHGEYAMMDCFKQEKKSIPYPLERSWSRPSGIVTCNLADHRHAKSHNDGVRRQA